MVFESQSASCAGLGTATIAHPLCFTEYFQPGTHGIVTLDETPIGCFLEIEGAPRWIDLTARRLGFQKFDYITASYGRLYQEFSKARGAR
jgi:hypothetical protein